MKRPTSVLAAIVLAIGPLSACATSGTEPDDSATDVGDRTAFYDEFRAAGQGWDLLDDDAIDEVLDATCDTWKSVADLEADEPGTIESLGLEYDSVQSFVFAISADLMAGESAPGSPERLAAIEVTVKIMARCADEHPELVP